MFPLQKRILIRGAAAHVKAGLGIAADYVADYMPFSIPFSGKVETYYGIEGGNWLRLTRPNGDKIELAHLSKYQVKNGNAVEGQLGGITGNTGAITTGAHLHIQIFNKSGKRLDPETYNWNSSLKQDNMFRTYKGTIYLLGAGFWIAVSTSGDEFKKDWNISEFPPEMTEAQFKAFPVNKRTIK
jgi:hypothetical protein